jgi:hypothetical protein
MSIQNESQFLTDETLHEAYEIELKSKNGKPVRFGELVAGKGESVTTLVIFSKSLLCQALPWNDEKKPLVML